MREALEPDQSTRRNSKSMARCTATRRCRKTMRDDVFPGSRLKGEANLLIMPTLDAANIAFNLLKIAAGNGITVGPILLGSGQARAHSSRRQPPCAASST